MSTDYRPLEPKLFPVAEDKNPEEEYWSQFKEQALVPYSSYISDIAFSPVAPYEVAVASSMRVVLYDSYSAAALYSLTRFKAPVFCVSFRQDGKLLAAGSQDGVVRVFNPQSRAMLGVFRKSRTAVRAVQFSNDKVQLLSGTEDGILRVIDLPTGDVISSIAAHTDHLRVIRTCDKDSLVLTGSYDHSAKLWDLRTSKSVMSVNHDAPIENAVMLPGGSLLITSGGNYVHAWDLFSSGSLLHQFSRYQRTVTSLCLNSSGSRLLTAGLDKHLKVFELSSYSLVYNFRCEASVVSLALAPDDRCLAIGMVDSLSLRIRPSRSTKTPQVKLPPRRGTVRYFFRGKMATTNYKAKRVHKMTQKSVVRICTMHQSASPNGAQVGKKQRLQPYDTFLKKFKYRAALDAALATKQPSVVAGMLEELMHRDGLRIALSGRNEVTLEPLFTFLAKFICVPNHADLLLAVCSTVVDLYASSLGTYHGLDEFFYKLQRILHREIDIQENLYEVIGSLDMLLAAHEL